MHFYKINTKNCYFHCNAVLNKKFIVDSVKLIEYLLTSAVIALSSHSCVELVEPLFVPEMTFLPKSKFEIKKGEYEFNPLPCLK